MDQHKLVLPQVANVNDVPRFIIRTPWLKAKCRRRESRWVGVATAKLVTAL